MANLFNSGSFDASTLTTRANDAEKYPFISTETASLFETDSVDTKSVDVDREQWGVQLMRNVARGTTSPAMASSRTRGTFALNGFKVGDRLVITPSQIDSVRRTGLQAGGEALALEKLDNVIDKGFVEKFGNLDHTLEFMRMTTLKAKTQGVDAAGNVVDIVDWNTLYGLTPNATLYLQLDEASPKGGALRSRYMSGIRTIREKLGGFRPTGYRAVYKGQAWDAFVEHKEVRDGFARQDGGAYLTQDGFEAIRFAGVEHMEYRGSALEDGEVVLFPLGVPGMLKTIFTTCDKLPLINEPGLPRFVIPKNANDPFQDFGEGAEWEISSIPAMINLRPEAVINATAFGAAPAA